MFYMKNWIIVFLFCLISCGKHDEVVPAAFVPVVPPTFTSPNANLNFAPYFNAFIQLAAANNYTLTSTSVNITLQPSYSGSNIIGTCTRGGGMIPLIQMNPSFWNNTTSFSNSRRAIVMFHELGHCLLNLSHDDSTIVTVDGRTVMKSLMSTYELTKFIFETNYTYYTSELFDSSFTMAVYYSGQNTFPGNQYASRTTTTYIDGTEVEGITGEKFE